MVRYNALWLLLIPVWLSAGTTGKIAGVVKDAASQETLPGVNIIIEGSAMGAASNLDGSYFIINVPPGRYNLRATMMGYNTVVQTDVLVQTDHTTTINFSLSSTVLDIGKEITVVAERPIVQKDVTSGRAIITTEEMKEMPVESFTDVLKTKAGITEGANGALHIRGGRASEIGYMIDGVAVSNPMWGGLSVSVENTAIQELQVVSGTFNAEYGQAMSGIVNIVTKDGGDKYSGNLELYLGDKVSTHKSTFLNIEKINPASLFNGDASLSGPVPGLSKKLSFFVSGRYFDSQGWLYGKREHSPNDVMYVDSSAVLNLVNSPYNAEPFTDSNGNGRWDSGEPLTDMNGNGSWDGGRLNFIEPYDDDNGNGQWDSGEPFTDYNMNGTRDGGYSGDNSTVAMNPYRKVALQSKLTYKFTGNLILRYGFLFSDVKNQSYDHLFKYNPDGRSTHYGQAYSHTLDWTHSLSGSTFYTIKANANASSDEEYLYKSWQDSRYLPNMLTQIPGREFYGGGQDKSYGLSTSKTYVARFDLTNQWNKTHQFKLGAELRRHDLSSQYYYVDIRDTYDWVPTIHTPETSTANNRYDHRKPTEFSAYLQDKIELQEMIVNIGLRYDYFDSNWKVAADNRDKKLISAARTSLSDLALVDAKAKEQLSPRLGIAYPITDRGTIYFSYGHFFQIPPFAYLYSNPEFEVISGRFNSILGNADLNPQSTITYEIGLKQQLADDIGIEAICFYKDINDLLGSQLYELYSRGDYYARYGNKDYGNVQGVTFSFEKRRGRGLLSASLDYTYQFSESNASSPEAAFVDAQSDPPVESQRFVVPVDWDQRHTLNFNVTLSKPRNWAVSLLGRLGSGLPYTPALQGVRTDYENSERKPMQYTFDLNAHKDFYIGKMKAAVLLKIYNLFDRLNEDYVNSDTGRATYSLVPTYAADHGGEFGRHYLSDYLSRPTYYSSPREIRLGLALGF